MVRENIYRSSATRHNLLHIQMSRIIETLRSRLSTVATETARACVAAELGCYLARSGQLDEAIQIVINIRGHIGVTSNPTIACWVLLLEGIIRHFDGGSESPLDRIGRSFAMSLSLGDRRMIARTAAWKAHMEFQTGEFNHMRVSINSFIENAGSQDVDALIRCAMVLGNAYTLLDNMDAARSAFRVCHRLAIDIGDESTISAIIFNRVSHKISRCRYEFRRNLNGILSDALMRLEISSSKNFDAATGVNALAAISLVWRARLLMLQDQSIAALEQLKLAAGCIGAGLSERSSLSLDLAWCYFRLDDIESASLELMAIPKSMIDRMDLDDQSIYYGLLYEVTKIGDPLDLQLSAIALKQSEAERGYDGVISSLAISVAGLDVLSIAGRVMAHDQG